MTERTLVAAAEDSLEAIIRDIEASLDSDIASRCTIPSRQLAEEYVSQDRIRQQMDLLESTVGPLAGRKVLEVGSGYGMFVSMANRELKAECFGVEPGSHGHAGAASIGQRLLRLHGLEPWRILFAAGEGLPLRAAIFDVVYSLNVLEHVRDPRSVIRESVRVLKPGGHLFFVVPNYGSFWEGHYGLIWIPYLSHRLARWYVRLLGRNPAFLESLQFVNYFSLRRCLLGLEDEVEVLSWGEDVFRYRMSTLDFGSWAALGMVKRLVGLARTLRLNRVAAEILVRLKAQTPLVLVARKKG